jgi:Domain of unknown function (DUF4395)
MSADPRRSWMDTNLDVQGYCLSGDESHALRWGLRFPTAVCLALLITGLALQSAVLVLALVPIGTVAGWTWRHPFDLNLESRSPPPEWGAQAPSQSDPKRQAFKLGTVWLLAVGLLFAFGQPIPALILGVVLVAVCSLVTITNFCIPSTLLAAWWRWHGTPTPTTQPG